MHKDDRAIQKAMGYKVEPLTPTGIAAAKCYLLMKEDSELREKAKAGFEFYRTIVDAGREQGLHNIPYGTGEYLALVDTIEYLHTKVL